MLIDLVGFTGLSRAEVAMRLSRFGRYHFKTEWEYWNPQSNREQARHRESQLHF